MYKKNADGSLVEDYLGMSVMTDETKKFYLGVVVPVMQALYKETKKANFTGLDFDEMIAECMGGVDYNPEFPVRKKFQ